MAASEVKKQTRICANCKLKELAPQHRRELCPAHYIDDKNTPEGCKMVSKYTENTKRIDKSFTQRQNNYKDTVNHTRKSAAAKQQGITT